MLICISFWCGAVEAQLFLNYKIVELCVAHGTFDSEQEVTP